VAIGKGRNLPLLHAGKVAPEPLVGHAVLRHDLLDGAQGRGRAVRANGLHRGDRVGEVETGGVLQEPEDTVHAHLGIEVDDQDRDAEHRRNRPQVFAQLREGRFVDLDSEAVEDLVRGHRTIIDGWLAHHHRDSL
jgi:hypothetical protein